MTIDDNDLDIAVRIRDWWRACVASPYWREMTAATDGQHYRKPDDE